MEDEYEPLLDDDNVNAMFRKNHEWIIHKIKSDVHGKLRKKKFILFPRSQRSIDCHCMKDDYLMVYWREDNRSRLIYSCFFLPDGKQENMEVYMISISLIDSVPRLFRISEYCFLFHSSKPGMLIQTWSNQLSFRNKKHIHSYIRKYSVYDRLNDDE